LFLRTYNTYNITTIHTTPRINLPKKEDLYFNKPYRYVTQVTKENKIPGKEALVRRLLDADSLSEQDIEAIKAMLDYNLRK
jgi:hypothetical protein